MYSKSQTKARKVSDISETFVFLLKTLGYGRKDKHSKKV